MLDAVGDLAVDLAARTTTPAMPASDSDTDDLVAEVEGVQVCAASIGGKATLAVIFDGTTKLAMVRQRMKRARELIARSLDAR